LEVGFRWKAWKGVNLNIGAVAFAAADKDLQIDHWPGIGHTITF
jgi:hypothetical protein